MANSSLSVQETAREIKRKEQCMGSMYRDEWRLLANYALIVLISFYVRSL